MKVANILVCHSYNPEKLFKSIPSDENPWFVFLHGMDQSIEGNVRAELQKRKGCLFDYKNNRGLARSWNDGIEIGFEMGCDAFFLLNDDLFFLRNRYGDFLQRAQEMINASRDLAFISLQGLESGNSSNAGKVVSQGFSCCILTRLAIETVGYFDQNFFPAYFEDCDYIRRIKLAGLDMGEISECMVEHERSGTISKWTDAQKEVFWNNFSLNKEYFRLKWGGYNDEEVFERPFDSNFSFKIADADRHVPYPGFHRPRS